MMNHTPSAVSPLPAHPRRSSPAWRGTKAMHLLLACGGLLVGCSDLTAVDAPDVVQPPALATPAGALALRAGAINGFTVAFTGDARGQVTTSGAMADEFFNAATSAIPIAEADQRIVPDPSASYPYAAIQRARLDARRAIAALEQYAPTPRSRVGELYALAAYSELFLAENMCAGIPLGEIVDGEPLYGQPLGRTELFSRAIADFDSAITNAADSARILQLGRIGRGRALLGDGRFTEAAAAVASVPTGYSYATQQSAATQPNGVFSLINNSRYVTVANLEGRNGLNFRAAADPRVPTVLVGKGIDGITDVYGFTRYNSLSSPVVLASGIEARLIEAESALHDGDFDRAFGLLNDLRSTVPGLAPLVRAGTDSGQVSQLFRERAFWLFATGHRHGDLRRLVRQYGRPAESVFPTGPYKVGQSYGGEVTFTPDASQLANPAFKTCESRAP